MNYPYYNKKSIDKVKKVLSSGKVNYWTGNHNLLFEKEFSKYIGNRFSITVSNGSVALEIALKALNLKPNHQVLVSSRSFIISASCVLNLGLKPVFTDVDHNGNMNIKSILKAYNNKVKAIILVHLNGLSCDMDPIIRFAKKKKIFLIEDCSQAHGAIYKGKKVGSYGDISTWSFCQDKIITTGGEGGIISTNNKRLWEKVWSLKDHGKNYEKVFKKKHKTGFRWLHDSTGSNYRMTEMQAVLGRDQLKSLDKQIKKRNFIASLYLKGLKDYFSLYNVLKKPNFKCLTCPLKTSKESCKNCLNAFYRLNLYLNTNKINQIKLISMFNKKKINCSVGACPEIYREKIFQDLKLSPKKRLPNAKLIGETSLMFPINPYRDLKKIKLEIKLIKSILSKFQ